MTQKIHGKILVIDDDKDVLTTSRMILKQYFSDVITLENPDHLKEGDMISSADVIILDMNFKPGDTSCEEGIIWLKKILKYNPGAHVLMNTAYGDIELAVKAMKIGAIDFLVKPWTKEKLLATVMATYRLSRAHKQLKNLKNRQQVLINDLNKDYTDLIAHSKSMKPVLQTIHKVAPTDANILVLGENGTGKELIARIIHRESLRKKEAFISVDLGAIPETLFESELFGHTKGAFTDAIEEKPGRFEIASGGTLFLDEIGNLSPSLQAKLLTVIQNREVTRVGGSFPLPVDIRLISATNKPIHQMTEKGEFRQDLLYRINTVEIHLPPLRERREDIVKLSNHYLKIYKNKYNKPELVIGNETYKKLREYHWPGNIRELAHAVERAVIMSEQDILQPGDFLIGETSWEQQSESLKIDDIEKTAITNVMKKGYKNMDHVAEELGLSRSTLYRKLKKYGLS
jgi:two-component system response regulator HydG